MCNRLGIKVKGVSRYTPQFSFVPCGVCEECRENQRAGWTFRLRAEFEHLQQRNFQFAFLTLTYKESCIPRMPLRFFKKECKKKYLDGAPRPLCFSKKDVKDYIIDIRQWLIRNYDCVRRVNKQTKKLEKDDALRYLLGSELGDHTKRPHYHIILAFPRHVPAEKLFNYMKSAWKFGFTFPRDFLGGIDCHGYNHMPFIIDSIGCATAYASKYVCKDIGFYKQCNLSELHKKIVGLDGNEEKLSDFLPFHAQSRSLGACFLEHLTDRQKLDLLLDGHAFIGEFGMRHLPVYLRNKLIYNNVYIFDKDGKRLCRREANEFFKKHYSEIFKKKVEFMEPIVKKCLDESPRILNYISAPNRSYFGDCYRRICNLSSSDLAAYVLSCGNVNKALCYDIPLDQLWLTRYMCVCDSDNVYDYYYKAPLINFDFLESLNVYFNTAFQVLNYLRKPLDNKELEEERKIQLVKQFFKGE